MIIESLQDLKTFIPHVQKVVGSEQSMFEKLSPHLEAAEQWLVEMTGADAVDRNRSLSARYIMAEGMRSALALLDVVFSANGLAVVSTETLAPASKERSAALVKSMTDMRDRALDRFLRAASADEDWLRKYSPRWCPTLWPALSLTEAIGTGKPDYAAWLKASPKMAAIENRLADDYFSQALIDRLRAERAAAAVNPDTGIRALVADRIAAEALQIFSGGHVSPTGMLSIIDMIKANINDFEEWASSSIGKLHLSPTVFVNKKKSGGYFF